MRDPNRNRYYRSFFSDESDRVINACRYRSRALEWLSQLGLKLETSPLRAGRLEKSIAQVNWLPSQSINTKGQNNYQACSRDWEFFMEHLRAVEPSLILFLSVDLLYALNSDPCRAHAIKVLGQPGDIQTEVRDLILQGTRHPGLKVGMQVFERATAIALPHPAYKRGVKDEYIASFRDWVGPALKKYAQVQCEHPPCGGPANKGT